MDVIEIRSCTCDHGNREDMAGCGPWGILEMSFQRDNLIVVAPMDLDEKTVSRSLHERVGSSCDAHIDSERASCQDGWWCDNAGNGEACHGLFLLSCV